MYGITKWISKSINEDIVEKEINESIDRLTIKPIFDEVSIVKYDEIKEYTIVKVNSRRIAYAISTIVNANYLCEVNNKHLSFIRKANGKNYTEAHHLIPLKFQKFFQYSLDVPANIISLCSNCHNMFHYGANIKELLEKMYLLRKKELKKYKIDCGFDKLCEYYHI